MKRIKSYFLLVIALFWGTGTAFAAGDFSAVCSTGQTLYYNIINPTQHYVEITYPGPSDDAPWDGFTQPTGAITLPSTVNYNGVTYTVKAIGRYAFYDCGNLTGSLVIPNTVASIGDRAFYLCEYLDGTLTIPSSVTTIGEAAFGWCQRLTGTLTIPNSVTSIGNYAFFRCTWFTGLTIGNAVTAIGDLSFSMCVSMTGKLTIPNSVTTIGESAFNYCYSFTSLSLGSSLISIGDYAFFSCNGFTGSLAIPNSVTTIGKEAFYECTGFNGTLTLGNSVTTIGELAFYYCNGFKGSLTIPNSVTSIGYQAFYFCSGFTGNLTIGSSLTSIGSLAFMGCSGFAHLNYNAVNCGDLSNASRIFEDFTGTITIGNAVQRIPAHLLYDCSDFTGTLTIPSSVTSIGKAAFRNCSGFTQVNYNAVNCADAAPEDYVFQGCIGTLTIGNGVQRIPAYMFYYSNFTGSLTIPDSVTEIGQRAFYRSQGFTGSLTIGNSVAAIGDYAFYECDGFTGSLAIPDAVTSMGTWAFNGCNGFTGSLTIGNSLTTIPDYAFRYCTGFTGLLSIGSAVTQIGEQAFRECNGLIGITACPAEPPTLIGSSVFYDVPKTIPVYVPCGSLENYQAANGWKSFTNMQCPPELTVFDGTITNSSIPANIIYFDMFTRSQFVIPASALEMASATLFSMTFYTPGTNVPYTTESDADVYLKEVDYTSISAFEPKASATTVYSGRFSIESAGSGGEMTIQFDTPYTYHGGNLLVGIENTEINGWKEIGYYGQTVNGASISGYSNNTGTIVASQQNFIPKTTFGCVAGPKSLPYAYGFEDEDEFGCWTMLNNVTNTGRTASAHHEGSYGFQFWYTTDPPQYLISPKFESTAAVDLSFFYKNEGENWPETFQVGYSTTTKSPEAFTWGEEVTATNSTWSFFEDTFPEGTCYIAIKHLSNNMNVLYVDDFHFTPVFCDPENRCDLTFTLTDSYGDGWNGAAINVMDVATNTLLVSMSAPNHSLNNSTSTDIYSFAVCNGRELRLEWVSGSYDEECSYTVTDSNGTIVFEGSNSMSEPFAFVTSCGATQSIDLASGWNWVSFNVEITMDDLKSAVVAAAPGAAPVIKSKGSGQTSYNGAVWVGALKTLDLSQMYEIKVANACTVTLEGIPVNPADHPATIKNGVNWIAYPLSETKSVANAFAGFPVSGDNVKSKDSGQATWNGVMWLGALKNLVPGTGYLYISKASGDKTLTF